MCVSCKDDFYNRMRIVCMAIPEGKVATYGQIAMLCGKPKNARQVGYGLKHDLAGADVPAFRVVNGKGGVERRPPLSAPRPAAGIAAK